MARLKEYNGHYCESEYEYAFIGFLEAEGWKYSSGNNIRRVTKRDVLIVDDFKKFIADTNPDLTEDEVTQVYDNVRLVGAESDFATLHKVYGWMVNGVQFTPQDGLPRMIPLIEFDNWDKNIFRVVNQFTVEYTNNGQKENRRPDVLLFVNGMPLCVIELKNPADANATIYDAWEQINIRYWRDIPHLLHYCPLACISDGVKTRLGTVRTPYEHFYAWRRVNEGDVVSTLPFAETETMIKGVYTPERFVEIFRDYIYFQDSIYDSDEVEMSSMEIILGEPSRLERLATDIHNHYVASCAGDPDRIQKAMVVCSNRKIAYALLQKFKDKYPEWFEEKKSPDGVSVTEEELKELKLMPFMAMVSSVGSNDEKDMYDYLGGVKNDKRSEELDAAFKQEKSNFSIVIVVDMWITGFDVPYLLGLDHAKVVLNVMAWLSGLMIAVTGYRHINWKELLKMSAVMLVGMFAGIQICRIVKSENILLTIYGIIIVVVALKNLCIHTEKKLPDLILWIVLILAGIIHGMFVSGGALLVIYATQVLKEKEEFRATVAPVWVVLNFFLMVTQFRSGLVGTADIRLICISILPLLIATWLGKKLVCKVSQKVFLNLTYILLLISGVSLIV